MADPEEMTEIVLEEEPGPGEIHVESAEEPKAPGEEASAQPGEEEHGDGEAEEYGKRVQKRIGELTKRARDEERDKQEAVRLAQYLMEENERLKSRVQTLDTGFLSEYGARVETQLSAARSALKEATEAGDSEAIVTAQEALARAATEDQRYKAAKKRAENVAEAQPAAEAQQAQPPMAPQPPQAPAVDPKAQAWAEKNSWFGQDEVMTYAAFGVHQKLVEEGFDPNADEYYDEIDRRMRDSFPVKFSPPPQAPNGGGAAVAPAGSSASRSPKSGRRVVKLSPSQLAIAKKLGVPPEEYAKYVKD